MAGREKLRRQHASGSPGIQVCTAITELLDEVLLDLYRDAVGHVGEDPESLAEKVALIPYGGYGRRDVAPFSDVDLMWLQRPGLETRTQPIIRRFTQNIFDVGLHLGFSPRTPDEACKQALQDATILTSLSECRLLTGSPTLFDEFQNKFQRITRRRQRRLIATIDEARRVERVQYGETNYLLEPNIKRSRGGLRDIQLIRWIGFLQCGEADPENLVRHGLLAREDFHRIRSAREFLLRLRNELHFQAGKSQDLLTRGEQVRIAELYGYKGSETELPVEQLMRDYFRHTSEVRYIASNFLADARAPSALGLLAPLVSYRLDGEFRVGPSNISVTKKGMPRVCGDPAEILHLMELANLTDKRIEHRTWSAIREAMLEQPQIELSPAVAHRFLSLMAQPARLGELLRRLHELRVLEKIIPALAHARHLMQFNDYHKFTVDEHSIRAVERATEFRHRKDVLGQTYVAVRRKDLLHLALLIHDLGKGYPGDHSEVGRQLAQDVGEFLGLKEEDTETIKFLVHKHLVMSHLAQWRDTNDDKVVIRFAVEVGSPERLQMLYTLTCADLDAVGPGVLNDWKLRLLTELYQRAMRHLAGDPQDTTGQETLQARRLEVRRLAPAPNDDPWWVQHVQSLPRSYLLSRPAEQVVAELGQLRQLPPNKAVAWGKYQPEQQTVEYTIGTYEDITPGIFHRLTGALTAEGLQILSAEIQTVGERLVLDRFVVQDGDYRDEPPADRIEQVCRSLVRSLEQPSDAPPSFRRRWSVNAGKEAASFAPQENIVRIDTSTSDKFTIIDVFTLDTMGLLYSITRTLFELGLSVGVAKIGTHLDQVVDVFYVTDRDGDKITNEYRLREIQKRILAAIAQLGSA